MARSTIQPQQGFTLIELLAAIAILALMAVLSWRGLDGISRTQQVLQQRADAVQVVQATLAQWAADLDALETQPTITSMDWDGRALRLLRRSSAAPEQGLLVVAWARQIVDGQAMWMRWQSPPVATRAALDVAWLKAAQWGQTPGDDDRALSVATVPLDQWQIFYYRGNAWTNPLSSAGTSSTTSTGGLNPVSPEAAATQADVPEGVRLVLTVSAGQAVSGTITRDWASPLLGGAR
jgi:general secretion pathway protein J